jgi:hypothetical protein
MIGSIFQGGITDYDPNNAFGFGPSAIHIANMSTEEQMQYLGIPQDQIDAYLGRTTQTAGTIIPYTPFPPTSPGGQYGDRMGSMDQFI